MWMVASSRTHRHADGNHQAMQVLRGTISGTETGTPPCRTWEGGQEGHDVPQNTAVPAGAQLAARPTRPGG